MTRVFISFASPDLGLAERLQQDLTKHGATVFQFNKSARAGRGAWEQVYNNIDESDYFLSLLTHDAIKSRPVNKEIEYADHRNTNNDGRPELVPVLAEKVPLDAKKWPQALRVLTPLDLSGFDTDPSKYESGVAALAALMGISGTADGHRGLDTGIDDALKACKATEQGGTAKIAIQFAGSPTHAVAPADVRWSIEVRNVGTVDLQSVRATLDNRDLSQPFSLAVGDTRQFTRTSRYAFPRSTPRTLCVRAVGSDGAPIAVEQSASVHITGSPATPTTPSAPAAPTTAAETIEVADSQFREQLEAKYSGTEFSWSAIGYPVLVLALGAAAAAGAVPLTESMLGWAWEFLFAGPRPAYVPGLLYQALEWIGTTTWVHWTSGVLAGLCIAIGTWVIAEDECPFDAIDYAKITTTSLIITLLISGIWALAHIDAVAIHTLALMAGGAVMLSSAVVGVYAFFDAI